MNVKILIMTLLISCTTLHDIENESGRDSIETERQSRKAITSIGWQIKTPLSEL